MSIYETYSNDQLENHFSNYLIDSWSFSKVSTFARHEKAFERSYIYREGFKSPASTIAGNAYHDGKEVFWSGMHEGELIDIIDVEKKAFERIDETPANKWKIQKTTPTVEECIITARKISSALIQNFFKEQSVYTSELKKVLAVEKYIDTWLTINGVDIPLPVHLKIDLVIELYNGSVVVIDHKSKKKFTDEKESILSIGKQAITYAKGYEKSTGIKVDQVWFIENKHSKNRDGSAQLKPIKVTLDKDTRRLYEALLYEPLRKMIQAVSDPDYVYMINDNDNFVDLAEIYDFWAKTMIAEVDDFDIKESKKDIIAKRLKKIRNAEIANIDPKVIKSFKKNAAKFITYDFNSKDMTKSEKIEHLLLTFGISVKIAHEFQGYSSDTLLLDVGVGTKIATVIARKMDIANALDVEGVRIHDNLFVYQDKSYVAVEIAKKREKDLLYDDKYLVDMKIPIGLDNFNNPVIWDLDNNSTPHLLVGGSTGSGKSVFLISTIAYAQKAGIENIIIFDPKYEFVKLGLTGVEIYNDIDDIEAMFELLVADMQDRVKSGVNTKTLVIADEFADLVDTSKKGNALKIYEEQNAGNYANGMVKTKRVCIGQKKSLEENLKMLLQKGRSLGFRVIAATQRASTKVITGDAKANFGTIISFRQPKSIDSKVMLDTDGAEILSKYGDGLLKSPEYLNITRFQAFYKQ